MAVGGVFCFRQVIGMRRKPTYTWFAAKVPDANRPVIRRGCDEFPVGRRLRLNRCPRCDVAIIAKTQYLSDRDTFLKLWAIDRVTRAVKGEHLVASSLSLVGS